jgi:hypothetical protein
MYQYATFSDLPGAFWGKKGVRRPICPPAGRFRTAPSAGAGTCLTGRQACRLPVTMTSTIYVALIGTGSPLGDSKACPHTGASLGPVRVRPPVGCVDGPALHDPPPAGLLAGEAPPRKGLALRGRWMKRRSITEKYRPTSLGTIWGQEDVVKVLQPICRAESRVQNLRRPYGLAQLANNNDASKGPHGGGQGPAHPNCPVRTWRPLVSPSWTWTRPR